MPVFDDDMDEPPPARPAPPAAGPPKPGRQNPLIPVLALRDWAPDPDDVAAALAPGRPKEMRAQGGANDTGTAGGHS